MVLRSFFFHCQLIWFSCKYVLDTKIPTSFFLWEAPSTCSSLEASRRRAGDSIGGGLLLLWQPPRGRWSTSNHVKYCAFLLWSYRACLQSCLIILRIYLNNPNVCGMCVVDGWGDCWVIKMSRSGLGTVIYFLFCGCINIQQKMKWLA